MSYYYKCTKLNTILMLSIELRQYYRQHQTNYDNWLFGCIIKEALTSFMHIIMKRVYYLQYTYWNVNRDVHIDLHTCTLWPRYIIIPSKSYCIAYHKRYVKKSSRWTCNQCRLYILDKKLRTITVIYFLRMRFRSIIVNHAIIAASSAEWSWFWVGYYN